MDLSCILEGRNVVGECPVWDADAQALYWVDINRGEVHRRDATGAVATWRFGEPVSAVSLTTSAGVLLVAVGGNLLLWYPPDDSRTMFARVESRWPLMRLNDGAVGPSGELWIGSMTNNVAADGSAVAVGEWGGGTLYRVDASGTVAPVDSGFKVPNTVAWNPEGDVFYCGCSVENTIWEYEYNIASQSIFHRRAFVLPTEPGCTDGSAIDEEGFLWNCRWGGGAILRISSRGEVVSRLDMPISNPTSCAFGGPGLSRLYVTSAALGTSAREVHAGGLFCLETSVRGLPARRFRLSA